MAELATIARPYAEALFKSAAGAAAGLTGQMSALSAVSGNEQLRQFADNPKVGAAQVFEVVTGAAQAALDPKVSNLLSAVIENGRLSALPEIAAQFHALRNAAEGRADLVIESAFPLEGAELAGLVVSLEKKFARQLNYSVVIVPELIGGVRVTVGDEVLDASVRGRLAQMATALQS